MLIVEVLTHGHWNEVGRHLPGQQPGSMSDSRGGVRQILLFQCTGEESSIYRLALGVDVEVGQLRLLPKPLEASEVIATLRSGQSTTITVKTDKSGSAERVIRFRHV